jgi:hypothetical protein
MTEIRQLVPNNTPLVYVVERLLKSEVQAGFEPLIFGGSGGHDAANTLFLAQDRGRVDSRDP